MTLEEAQDLAIERGNDLLQARADLAATRAERDRLRAGLEWVRGDACTNFHGGGYGACYREGRTEDAEYGADLVCDSCRAHAALTPAGEDAHA